MDNMGNMNYLQYQLYTQFLTFIVIILIQIIKKYNKNQFEQRQKPISITMTNKLAKSRFLQEEVNLLDIPTQEEVLERAEELEIDDLSLARESLTKEMELFWKPYSNRYSDIYYVNFRQRKAYVDHPIDMQTKIKYAKSQGLFIPRFKSYDFQDVIGSMQLVQHQTKLWQRSKVTGNSLTQALDSELNIVYQQSGEQSGYRQNQQSSSSNSYIQNLQYVQDDEGQVLKQVQIQLPEQLQKQLLLYENQIRLQNLREVAQYKQKKQQNFQLKFKMHKQQNNIKRLEHLKHFQRQYQAQINEKQEHQFIKQKYKLQSQNYKNIQQFQSLLQSHTNLIQEINRKRIDVEPLIRRKFLFKKIALKESQQNQIKKSYRSQLSRVIQNGVKQYNQSVSQRIGGTSFYQKLVDEQLKKIEQSIQNCKRPRRKKIFSQQDQIQQSDKQNLNSQNIKIKTLKKKQNFIIEKNRQIQQTKVWTANPQTFSTKIYKKQIQLPIYYIQNKQNHLSSSTQPFKKKYNKKNLQFCHTQKSIRIVVPDSYNPRNGMYLRLMKRII